MDLTDRTTLHFALFAGAALLLFCFLQKAFWKHQPWKVLTFAVWAALPVVFVCSWLAMERMAERESRRMAGLLEGYAPVFASAMEAAGHSQLPEKPAPDHAEYLKLIEMEKTWLKANPSVVDIFTLRKNAEGKWALLVDSETDYDRNGVWEGDREVRTVPGEVIKSAEVMRGAERVLNENTSFLEPRVYTDRWGRWISTYAPLRAPDGRVEGVLGVDLNGADWDEGIRMARVTVLNYCALIIFSLCGVMTMASMTTMNADSRNRRTEAVRVASERDRIDELVNTIDGVIYERNASTGEWLYVSRQVGSLLGYSPEEFGKNAGFWRSCILPEHQQMAAATEGVSRTLEYEVRAKDGRKIWIRDSALLIAREESHIVRGVLLDITREREADEELARANRMLVQTSRQAGMAEVATGVLHNVGNVLNSVNVAGNLLQESVRTSALPGLGRLCGLLDEHQEDLAEFLTKDPRGRSVAGYLKQLNQTLEQEQSKVKTELATLTTGVQHLQEIVATQQSHARTVHASEQLEVSGIVEDAVRLAAGQEQENGDLQMVCSFEPVPPVCSDRHKVLQILINLLRNAREALRDKPAADRRITVRLCPGESGMVDISVTDNGTGIAPENLTRIFSHGFTTRRDGHGFGLHTSALTARTLGGCLRAFSSGPGLGARFTLSLPCGEGDSPLPAAAPSFKTSPVPLHAIA